MLVRNPEISWQLDLVNKAFAFSKPEPYKGVQIHDLAIFSQSFLRIVKEAIDLIEEIDASRFRRVTSDLTDVINTKIDSLAQFMHTGVKNICIINDRLIPIRRWKFEEEHYHPSALLVAIILVHEATHARLHNPVLTDLNRREKEERICHDESRRFAKKFYSDSDMPQELKEFLEFDLEGYQKRWNRNRLHRLWDHLKAIFSRT